MTIKLPWLVVLAALAFSHRTNADIRAFTNDNGYVIQAELVSHKGGKIMLKRIDGKEFEADPAIFSPDDEAYIQAWMKKNPPSVKYNLRITTQKKKVEGNSRNMGYKRVRNDLWSFIISITNNSQEPVSNLTVNYRVFYSNAADGSYSSSSSYDQSPIRMIEGKEKLEAELGFNRTLDVITTPVNIDTVDYEGAGSRYKDELKGCLVHITDKEGKTILDWVSPEVAMKNKTWRNTNPGSGPGEKTGSVIIR